MTAITETLTLMRDTVRAGAELLDRECPGWADRIDLDRLEMSTYSDCILGQLFGDYADGLDTLGLPLDFFGAERYGFTLPAWGGWDDLRTLWVREIADRVTTEGERS